MPLQIKIPFSLFGCILCFFVARQRRMIAGMRWILVLMAMGLLLIESGGTVKSARRTEVRLCLCLDSLQPLKRESILIRN